MTDTACSSYIEALLTVQETSRLLMLFRVAKEIKVSQAKQSEQRLKKQAKKPMGGRLEYN